MSALGGNRAFDHEGEPGGVEPVKPSVPRYFFDTRDNDNFTEDDVGIDLPDLEAVKAQAALSLAELARDVLPGNLQRDLAVEARDDRQPVLQAKLKFEAHLLVGALGSTRPPRHT